MFRRSVQRVMQRLAEAPDNSSSDPMIQGLLEKKPCDKEGEHKRRLRETWKKRFFVLVGSELRYYKCEDDARKGKPFVGSIECARAEFFLKKVVGTKFRFTIRSDTKELKLRADGERDFTRWKDAIAPHVDDTTDPNSTALLHIDAVAALLRKDMRRRTTHNPISRRADRTSTLNCDMGKTLPALLVNPPNNAANGIPIVASACTTKHGLGECREDWSNRRKSWSPGDVFEALATPPTSTSSDVPFLDLLPGHINRKVVQDCVELACDLHKNGLPESKAQSCMYAGDHHGFSMIIGDSLELMKIDPDSTDGDPYYFSPFDLNPFEGGNLHVTSDSVRRNAFNGDGAAVINSTSGNVVASGLIVLSMKGGGKAGGGRQKSCKAISSQPLGGAYVIKCSEDRGKPLKLFFNGMEAEYEPPK